MRTCLASVLALLSLLGVARDAAFGLSMRAHDTGTTKKGVAVQYVEDVFSTSLYTGNGSVQTITNGINLAGKGGMVWMKRRDAASIQTMWDFKWGSSVLRYPNLSLSQSYALGTFNSDGYFLNSNDNVANAAGGSYVSWTFREAPKFFAEASANVNSDAVVSFPELGTIGMVIVQGTFGSDSPFYVWHRSLTGGNLLQLNSTGAQGASAAITVSGTDITLPSSAYDGGLVIVYAFAHDVGADGVIQAGSLSHTNGTPTTVSLGWEPQYVMYKNANGVADWHVYDSARGMTVDGVNDKYLVPNTDSAESLTPGIGPTATGFIMPSGQATSTFIYLAIRRGPMRAPTSAAQVFSAISRFGTAAATAVTGVGFPPDLVVVKEQTMGRPPNWWDRSRGSRFLDSSAANAESGYTGITSFDQNGVTLGADGSAIINDNYYSDRYVNHFFRRARGFFDAVAYTGTGVGNSAGQHGLGVPPEMVIFKNRGASADWGVWHTGLGNSAYIVLNSNSGAVTGTFQLINTTPPTATNFTVWNNAMNNASGNNYVAYFFASRSGISKVGSYTGDGASGKAIDCGFSTGARFIMVKRTDSIGDWYLWDSVRGIVAGPEGQSYTTPGTYQWTAPAGVTSVNVVAVGGGATSSWDSGYGAAGGGGALAYKNNISVTPGNTYTVVVGGGASGWQNYAGDSSFTAGFGTMTAGGGGRGADGGAGGTRSGIYDGGGTGGSGGTHSPNVWAGGGGAGGYSGNGGAGAQGGGAAAPAGGGGGGGDGTNAASITGGGGVGLWGEGSSGGTSGGGGSGGTSAAGSPGGAYGGGGATSGSGASGAVRIIWGTGYSFPSNANGKDPHLLLNAQAAEVVTYDSVDAVSGGFMVNQNAVTNININGASYIFFAVAN